MQDTDEPKITTSAAEAVPSPAASPGEPAVAPKQPISIWSWVGVVLSAYGAIITGMGCYFVIHPETKTATAHLNPSLPWGILMLLAGATFLWLGRRSGQPGRRANP